MNSVAHSDPSEDRDAKLGYFYSVIEHPNARMRVAFHIATMHEGKPVVTPSDVQASQTYLRACVLNMSLAELEVKTLDDFTSLWARGAVGSALYRARQR